MHSIDLLLDSHQKLRMTKMVREGWLIKLITVVVAMWERHKRCPQAARTQRRKGSFVLGNEFGTSRSMATVCTRRTGRRHIESSANIPSGHITADSV